MKSHHLSFKMFLSLLVMRILVPINSETALLRSAASSEQFLVRHVQA